MRIEGTIPSSTISSSSLILRILRLKLALPIFLIVQPLIPLPILILLVIIPVSYTHLTLPTKRIV